VFRACNSSETVKNVKVIVRKSSTTRKAARIKAFVMGGGFLVFEWLIMLVYHNIVWPLNII